MSIPTAKSTIQPTTQTQHWLLQAENRRPLWIFFAVLLVLSVLPEFFIDHYPHFKQQSIYLDASFGFYVWYGFLSCAAMVVIAKLVGIVLQRRDTYYDD